jgi:hypothetical protein
MNPPQNIRKKYSKAHFESSFNEDFENVIQNFMSQTVKQTKASKVRNSEFRALGKIRIKDPWDG